MSSGRHEQAQELSSSLIDLSLQGLHYFQTYDWPFLLSVVSLGYVGWIAFLVLHVVAHNTNMPAYVRHRLAQSNRNVPLPHRSTFCVWWLTGSLWGTQTNLLAALVGAALFGFLWLESSPIQYYLYTFFPGTKQDYLSIDETLLLTIIIVMARSSVLGADLQGQVHPEAPPAHHAHPSIVHPVLSPRHHLPRHS